MGLPAGSAVCRLLYCSIVCPIYRTVDDMAFVDAEYDDISRWCRYG
jgi:hypothetical protein